MWNFLILHLILLHKSLHWYWLLLTVALLLTCLILSNYISFWHSYGSCLFPTSNYKSLSGGKITCRIVILFRKLTVLYITMLITFLPWTFEGVKTHSQQMLVIYVASLTSTSSFFPFHLNEMILLELEREVNKIFCIILALCSACIFPLTLSRLLCFRPDFLQHICLPSSVVKK